MKVLSVAIPCYNSAEYMKNAIDSLLPGGEDIEILRRYTEDRRRICSQVSHHCEGDKTGEWRTWRSGEYRSSKCHRVVL